MSIWAALAQCATTLANSIAIRFDLLGRPIALSSDDFGEQAETTCYSSDTSLGPISRHPRAARTGRRHSWASAGVPATAAPRYRAERLSGRRKNSRLGAATSSAQVS